MFQRGGKYSYDQVKQFAQIIVSIVNSRIPDFTSIQRTPSKREKKVYLDFLQNRKGQTLAAPYCVRPKPFASVSAPVKWEEVNKYLRPENFTLKNILNRLDKIGDIWSGVLGEGIDLLNVLDKISTTFR